MDWIERVAEIRRWTRGGERAPHKPLLLLYVLGHFQRNGNRPIPFSAAEAELKKLLKEYGPPRDTSPGYPFHHLTSDGLWLVDTRHGPGSPGPELGRLRDSQASGRLHPDLARALSEEPGLLARMARYLLDANFAPSLQADLCLLAGLDLETLETGGEIRKPPVVRRGAGFRDQVLMAYEYCCAFCSYDGWLDGAVVGLDAAHVRWWAFDGPDDLANGLCLCAIHHKLFDKGVLGLTAERTIAVSARFVGRSQASRDMVLILAGRPVRVPQSGLDAVEQDHIGWHGRQVFRTPARG
ncbi:phosphorothioated DNA-binding restriction endonuclease [Nonomuraea sp. NEAU-A123]|uniref:phosphorothioated DNA-binding restriction endonuclease n=1 Tax=Nonomuraea sp. NEAU-A123 TaxID=2839649 RepID=UPI001BE3F971|nr:HNH endonuclease [Nonomuraea sp. NEAU-A123]MBT2235080.1 HNH endonuclease [Nonomuraea sp. NEAU-A123]